MTYCIERRLSGAGPVPAVQEVAAALGRAAAAALLTQADPTQPVWRYENPRTRVTAEIAVSDGQMVACLPVPRARFHLLEVAGLLGRVQAVLAGGAGESGLAGLAGLVGGTAPGGVKPGVEPDVEPDVEPGALPGGVEPDLAGWDAANQAALAGLGADAAQYAYLPPARGEGWWRYLMARQQFRLAWPSADVVIPDVLLIQPRQGGPVARLLIWPEEASSLVLPEVEYIAIRRPPRMLPGASPQPVPGLVPWQAALATLGEALDQHRSPAPHWLYRGGEAHPFRIRALLNQAGAAGTGYRPVPPDRVVDFPASAGSDAPGSQP